MSDSFTSQLLREMENALSDSQSEDTSEVNYSIICGLRQGSQLLWIPDEQQLFYRNSYSIKTKLTTYTCRVKNCLAKVYVNPDGTAFKDETEVHNPSHGSQYTEFKLMYCDNQMKEKAKTAPASMTPYEIYMEVVVE